MIERAPGGPGTAPTWTSSAKDMVGCALGPSRLWFTLGFGIVNEVYYPRVDIPQIRDLGFIIADGEGFWAEVKRVADYRIRLLAPGVPAVEVVHQHQRYSLRLRIAPDARCDRLRVRSACHGFLCTRDRRRAAIRLYECSCAVSSGTAGLDRW